MRELSPNEGLVYSALLSHSLMSISECFDVDGSFSIANARAILSECMDDEGIGLIDYSLISTRRLARHLSMKEDTVRKIKADLKDKHCLIGYSVIKCPLELLDYGYIDIPPDTKLRGRQLAFYGLLRDRSSMYQGVIDTWAVKLAEIAGTTKSSIYKMLSQLEKKGYVERLDDGKLKIK